jgi:hypothetical protein
LRHIWKKNLSQTRAGGVAQGVDPEFKPQYHKKKKKKEEEEMPQEMKAIARPWPRKPGLVI